MRLFLIYRYQHRCQAFAMALQKVFRRASFDMSPDVPPFHRMRCWCICIAVPSCGRRSSRCLSDRRPPVLSNPHAGPTFVTIAMRAGHADPPRWRPPLAVQKRIYRDKGTLLAGISNSSFAAQAIAFMASVPFLHVDTCADDRRCQPWALPS